MTSRCCTSSTVRGDIDVSAAAELTRKIRAAIPVSDAMQFSIDYLQPEEIRVSAPLQPNINVHGTGFAGSIYSLAILTGWALCTHILNEHSVDADLVVGKAEICYGAPVETDLEAEPIAGSWRVLPAPANDPERSPDPCSTFRFQLLRNFQLDRAGHLHADGLYARFDGRGRYRGILHHRGRAHANGCR